MKKQYTLVLTLLLFTSFFAKAQIFPYYFSVETEVSYTPLSDSISLNNGEVWDDPEYFIPLGFEFDFYDFLTDTLFMAGTGGLFIPDINETVQPLLLAYGSDIIDIGDTSDVSVSEISYKIEGTAGSQIAKIEWKNVGFYTEVAEFGTANNYLSFQLWLFEGTGDIEIHFGPNNIEDDNLVHEGEGPWMGIINGYDLMTDEFSEFWFLKGDPSNPVLDTIFSLDDYYTDFERLEDDPANGTVYRFSTSEPVSVISPVIDQKVLIYPTIANDLINIQVNDLILEDVNMTLFDAVGKQIMAQSIQNNFTRLNIQNLAPGIYFINIATPQGMTTKKIIRQ